MLETIRKELGALDGVEGGLVIDLMLTYRALGDWQGMIDLYEDMPRPLAEQVLLQEQLGFALNRSAAKNPPARAKALQVLKDVERR